MLAFFLLVFAEELADGLDPVVDLREGGAVIAVLERQRRSGARVHHLHVGPILVELDLVALARGVAADEGEEPEISLGVAGDEVVPLEMERREIAMVILQSLTHQLSSSRPGSSEKVVPVRAHPSALAS